MSDASPGHHPKANAAPSQTARSNLALRVASSLVIAPLAIAIAWYGGWLFAVFWIAAGAVVAWEWIALTRHHGMAIDASRQMSRALWIAAGLIYAAAIVAATLLLRSDASAGFAAILYLFAVVWLTDIAAYFAGRAIGGPKLMPRVSPKKTWSGAIGGTAAGVLGGVAVVAWFGFTSLLAVGFVALLLSIVSQAGDLVESAIKRHFGAKDSGGILPGHGGLMDRLDGYAAAVIVAALIGLARGGMDTPARGLLTW